MTYELQDVVPWGRSFDEYISMFSLSKNDLTKQIIGCGDGPASFNYSMSQHGNKCISVDPIYQFSKKEIQERIKNSYEEVLAQTRSNKNEFVWNSIQSVEELGKIRKKAMNEFIADYDQGKKEKRYISGELPELNFNTKQFDIALCSHFLFLYSQQFSLEFHVDSIIELCRIAKEVRIFPILELGTQISRHFENVYELLAQKGFNINTKKVEYEFQKGGNQLLIVE